MEKLAVKASLQRIKMPGEANGKQILKEVLGAGGGA